MAARSVGAKASGKSKVSMPVVAAGSSSGKTRYANGMKGAAVAKPGVAGGTKAMPSAQPNSPALGLPADMTPNANLAMKPNLVKSGPSLAAGSGKKQYTLEVLPQSSVYKK
jgi:hypothetical protein